MIPTVDNYFEKRFKKILNAILRSVDDKDSEAYIIDDALQGYSPEDRDSFKRSFCFYKNKSQYPIDVTLSYSNIEVQTRAAYVITRESGEEDTELGSIGQTTADTRGFGRADSGESTVGQEEVVIHEADEYGSYAETKFPILKMLSVAEMSSYIDYEHFEQGSNKFRLLDCSKYVGMPIHVSYVKADTGSHKGYSSRTVGIPFKENISIAAVSNNTTTVRELDTLLKYILVFMRDSYKESDFYQLPSIKVEPLGSLDLGKEQADSPVYGIKTIIEYTTTYQISKDSTTKIKDILLKLE